MNSNGLMGSLTSCLSALSKGNTELKTLAIKRAQTEKAYRTRKTQEIIRLKNEKYPATLIMEIVKGNKEVAELRLQRDVAESDYYCCVNSISNLRIEIEAIKSKLNYIRAELNNW